MATKDLLLLGFNDTKHMLLWGLGGGAAGGPTAPPFMFKRDTGIYVSKNPKVSADDTNTVKISVSDFSYNQVSNLELISKTAGLDRTGSRTVKPILTAVSPVSFSFTTYIRPILDTTVTSPEEYLWVGLMGYDNVISDSSSSLIDFSYGNVPELQELTIWLDREDHNEGNYRLDNAIIDSAEISFDINNIAQIIWYGRALGIVGDNNPPSYTDRTSQSECVKNKLTTVSLTMNTASYDLALTGGNISIQNNNTFYGRTRLGQITLPEGHFSGDRVISGSLNFYMKEGTLSSADFYNTILTYAKLTNYERDYLANVVLTIGGSGAPNIQVQLPQTLFEIGQQRFDEVISIAIPFVVQEESANYCTVTYQLT